MIEIFIVTGLLIISSLLWHLGYTEYKEREWRRNNPDEFKITKSPTTYFHSGDGKNHNE